MDQHSIEPIKVADLDQVRQKIDSIDDDILSLVMQRFDIVAQVRAAKLQQGDGDISPLRPAREAEILRRLLDRNDQQIPDRVILSLWRTIISASTLAQAPVQLNVSTSLLNNPASYRAISEHYVGFATKPYAKEKMALNSLAKSANELCVFAADGKWIDHLNDDAFADIQVIYCLPWSDGEKSGRMVVLGRAPSQRTGNDETLVKTSGNLPRDFIPGPLWHTTTQDGHTLTSLPGFLSTSDSPLVGLMRSNNELALKVLGRYPSPFEV